MAGQTPTAADLSGEFHQPFDDLAVLANKPLATEQVRQIRLCIEVLRRYLLPDVTPAPDYNWAAYTALLNQIGTSYEEIRLARTYLPVPPETTPPPQRLALADRLGIELGTTHPDPLDLLLLDPDAVPSEPNAINEQILEQLFGLVDTTRDALSVGAKLGDAQGQITRWNLDGVAWGRNTDLNGFVYVSLRRLSDAAFQVVLYRDAERTDLVASGQRASAAGAVILQPQNNSGLSGNFTINYTADSSAISLAVVPTFLSWQLARLRTLWQEEDYPATPPAGIPPIVDPDLLTPDDFRNKVSTDAAYNLYTTRINKLQGWFNDLKELREDAASVQEGLDTILQTVLGKSPDDLLALDQQRQQGADITSQLAAINLAHDAFSYLVRICILVGSNLPVLPTEWHELYSILVQVQKYQSFQAWRTEENAANITLGPDYFELSPLDAAPTPTLYSTGLDANRVPLSDGTVDPHWTISATPAGPTTASAYVTKNSYPVGAAWIANSDMSRWISPQTNEATGDAPGNYTYHTSFDLTGFDPATVRITARVAVDNVLEDVKLNGQSLGLTATGFAAFTLLSINSGFVANVNTLEFVVCNEGTTTNPSGLRVELAIAATPYMVAARPWRASGPARQLWRSTLQARIDQQQTLIQALRTAVDATEQATLPLLRDTLVVATPQGPDQLTQLLLIDVKASSYRMTTRLEQAVETIQGLFVALMDWSGRTFTSGRTWTLQDPTTVSTEWEWMGSYSTWQAAMSVFLWPENLLLPGLRNVSQAPAQPGDSTQAFYNLVKRLREYTQLTPDQARAEAAQYLEDVGSQPGLPQTLTEELADAELLALQTQIRDIFSEYTDDETPPHYTSTPPLYLQEAYYFVPMELALQLQQAGQFEAALAWFRTVYGHDLPATQERRIYYGLVVEQSTGTLYQRTTHWLTTALDPHNIATQTRANAYTCYTLMSILRCLLDYADAEFTADTSESVARARTLYITAQELYTVLQGLLPAAPGIEANPLPPALNQHAAVNLGKIRHGRNIAGIMRQLQTFEESRLAPAGMVSVQPTPYRYTSLIERAKQLVNLAQQIEGSYLAALEKFDAESYNILKARQDSDLADQGTLLQQLRVTEAKDGETLAKHQKDKSFIQVDHYNELIYGDLSENEATALALQRAELGLQTTAAGLYAIAAASGTFSLANLFTSGKETFATAAQGLSYAASAVATSSAIASTMASYERRAKEWEFQRDLARQEVLISTDQIQLATDRRLIVEQEQAIAATQLKNARATVEFLANKFTNAQLYEWMSGVLGRVYSYFLQQATAMARMAESQLAFERQERPPAVIQADYWQPLAQGSASSNGQAPDRKGLTGSARLLQDIYQLDQYAFETNKRKLQLVKSISLARLAPVEFQRFRESGVLPFATPMALFDRDFPGHYLRLIKRVRTSVIALVPPIHGIRATLSTSGVSRVAIGGDTFQTIAVRRQPESVALSSPLNATGLFELDSQPELLLPFESMGVDTAWEFEMPKAANPFDFRTIADVLITIEYTALNSFDYRQQIVRRLDRNVSLERAFSFRHQLADQWYDWHNPEQTATPMVVGFKTDRADFPPNVDELKIEQVALYFARKDGLPEFEVAVEHLTFSYDDEEGNPVTVGGGATSVNGVISTRRGNASSWAGMIGQAPFQDWELALPNTDEIKNRFKNEEIEDILFVITYSGQTPPWPL
ncbi:MAG: hypothetical protein L0332_15715 [Chloroflexi bacterium]|nr:hypothetical protein [Chloroflexota bacterium]MCI0647117.1 hypothetical protein [Chloroflexota bacterium]MCI0728148.1 hypothetical protein [Chloroflexota bacterium]